MAFSPDSTYSNAQMLPRSIDAEAFILASWMVFTTPEWAENPDWDHFNLVKSGVRGRLYMGQNVDILEGRQAYQAGTIWKLQADEGEY